MCEKMIFAFLLILFALTVISSRIFSYQKRLFQLAKQFKGPQAQPLVGNLLDILFHDTYHKLLQYCKIYQPTFRLWIGPWLFVVFTRPEDFETILHHPNTTSKSYNYKVMDSLFGHGLLNSESETWRRHRKIMNSAFTPATLQNYINTFYTKSLILVDKVKCHVNEGEFDIYNYIGMVTMDIVCATVLGADIGIQKEEHEDLVRALQKIKFLAHTSMLKPWYWCKFMRHLSKDYKNFKTLRVLFENVINTLIEKKEKIQQKSLNDMMERRQMSFLDLMTKSRKQGFGILNKTEVKDEALTLLITGTDTTTFIICCVLMLLGIHQDVQEKLVNEIYDIFRNDIYRETTYEDVSRMEYLMLVIKETLRLYQPIPIIGRKVEREGIRVGDYILPAGSCALLLLFASHRNPKYFPEPEDFNPDRFRFNNRRNRHPFDFIPFAGGHRNCIGQLYARLQMKTIISTFLKYYEVLPCGTSVENMEQLSMRLTLHMSQGYVIKIKRRHWENL